MVKLAINGGEKYRNKPFPNHPIIGEEEKRQVLEVLDSGNLSTFRSLPGQNFLGGKKIKEFESLFRDYFNVKHAIALNSGTAGLHAATLAIGTQPGDEILVSPYSFTSSATCALMNNAIPVFVDVDENNFCIDPKKLEGKITEKTKAIIPVHLFGGSADMDGIMNIADKYNLRVIEDVAQSIGADYKGKLLGTIGDCGIFSFQETKHVTTGEGGMVITNNDEIANLVQLTRNHGEVVVEDKPRTYNPSLLGFGYRMTEIDAAIGIAQFKKLNQSIDERIALVNYLANKIDKEFPGIKPKLNNENGKNVYFILGFKYDENEVGIPRNLFVEALNKEGIPFGAGYVSPLYLGTLYHKNKHYAIKNFGEHISYDKGICPIVERLHEKAIILTMLARPPATFEDMDDIVGAMHKIIDNKNELLENKL